MTPSSNDSALPGASSPALLRLLVVDADRRVRDSLAGLLDLADQVEVVASVGHARAALDACEERRPDAVIVDPRLPDLPDGIAFVRGLRASRPEVRVVVVAWSPSLSLLLGDDPGIRVVSPDGGDLADRIVGALRGPGGQAGDPATDPEADPGTDPGTDPDAMLGATA